MAETAAEVRETLNGKRAQWFAKWESRPARDFTQDEVSELQQLNAEMDDLGQKLDKLSLEEAARKHLEAAARDQKPVNTLPTPATTKDGEPAFRVKTLTEVFRESTQYMAFTKGAIKTAVVEIPVATFERAMAESKTLLTSSNWTIQAQRLPDVTEMAIPSILVSDLMMQGATDGPQLSYMEETTHTNNAAEVAEGGTKPESAFAFTERLEPVRKIATTLPVTDEMLADVPQMDAFIRGRLGFQVERRRETQLISGSGVSPNILGILGRTGIQTQALGTDPVPDAIYKAMIKINVNADADATAIVIHPNNWQSVRLLRTADGIYIWGSPSDPGVDRMWGLPVRKTVGITAGTALVGAFRPYAQLFRREGITITASTEHSTFFVENKVMILAEERVGLAVYRPAAFCTVTGLP